MIEFPAAVEVPLRKDKEGVIRVANTRVTLDTLIARHQQRETPEAIHAGFPTVSLTDIYAVIAYYLANRADVDAYLKQRDEEAERIRQEVEASYTPEQKARTEYFRALLDQKRREQELVMRFAADENFDGRILQGLQTRLPDLDIVRVQDTALVQSPDPELLDWLAAEGRILLTHDVQTMPGFIYERIRKGQSMPGVIEVRRSTPIGQAVDELEVIIGAGTPADFENLIRYVPMR